MRTSYEARAAEQTGIHRQICQGADRIVSRKFGAVAKVLWPIKTAANLAAIANVSERTACRWISGEFEPPASVIAATILEMTRAS